MNYFVDPTDLEINYHNALSSHFSATLIREEGSGYEMEECGSGNEKYRHIHTGRRNISQC